MENGNILVVEDELILCNLLSDVLSDKGYKVRYAQSGVEGIRIAREDNFDVIITDLKIPDKDGIEVLKEVKKINPDNAVIVVTGYPSFETVQAALRLGAYDYLTKPFNIDEIAFVVKRAADFRNLTLTNKRLMKELEQQNIKLEEKVRERTKELTLFYEIGRKLLSTLKLEEVLRIIVDNVTGILNVEMCSILLIDKETSQLLIKSAYGLDSKIITQTRLKPGEGISGWVMQHKEPLLVEDIETDPRFARDSHEKYYTHSFISVPLIAKDEVVGVINVNNKKTKEIFTKDDLRFVSGVANEAAIAIENAQLYTSLEDTYIKTVMSLTSAIDAKDHYTMNHSEHVTDYAVAIAKEMGLSAAEIEDIRRACQLHDLGKIGVHDQILTKPDKLNPDEWEEIKLHSSKSAEILKPLAFLGEVIILVEQHHERYDGAGYPHGLKGDQIKLGARILAVADSFDAMVTQRPYRQGLNIDVAIEEIKKNSGIQFDPKVVEAFLIVLKRQPELIRTT